jgi:hypothetical protein
MNPMLDTKLDHASTGAVPIRCFGGKDLQPDEPAWRQLNEMAALPGAREHVTVLPDVHYKSRNPAPSGTVLGRDAIFPRAIDDGTNCGTLVATGMDARLHARIVDAVRAHQGDRAACRTSRRPGREGHRISGSSMGRWSMPSACPRTAAAHRDGGASRSASIPADPRGPAQEVDREVPLDRCAGRRQPLPSPGW